MNTPTSEDVENFQVSSAANESRRENHDMLRDWLVKSSIPQLKSLPTLVDTAGVKRYQHNWQVVDESEHVDPDDEEKTRKNYTRDGIFCLSIKETNRRVLFVQDFKKLWNRLSLTPDDSFGSHALLYENTVYFFFGTTVNRILLYLYCFNSIIFIFALIFLPTADELKNVVLNILVQSMMYAGYLSCAAVYKASPGSPILISKTYANHTQNKKHYSKYSSKALLNFQPFSNAAVEYSCIKQSKVFVKAFCQELGHCLGLITTDRYDEFNEVESDEESQFPENNLDHGPSDIELQSNVHSPMANRSDSSKGGDAHPNAGVNTKSKHISHTARNTLQKSLDMLAMEGGSTPCDCGYMLLLNMGSQFLYKHTLKEMSIDKTGVVCVIACVVVGFTFQLLNCLNFYIFWNPSNTASIYFVILSFGLSTFYAFYLITVTGMAISVVGLLYGARIIHALAMGWVQRYSTLRLIVNYKTRNELDRNNSKQDGYTNYNELWGDDLPLIIDKSTTYSTRMLQQRIETDAYESYLFIHAYVKQISDLWSPLILILAVVTSILVGFLLWDACKGTNQHDAFNITLILATAVVFLIIGVFPIYCIAYANGATNTIRNCFHLYSTSNNYDIIGGREAWVEYLEKSPAYWTVFGFPLTWASLYSIVGTFLGSSMILAISYIRTVGGAGIGA